ncbi:iron chelate uptake ABC transporter family permease subunit [Roseibium sp. CAU 1637]|uniref:Iron chelate uptake ABC transporter family permease subunit n=1 Tax=Roseibium limicola TaxID=2816037 RepID=A0A939J3Q8_9HYPH|nr:iron chelate uptake ABC transporter family permease subunit [Roseibium limicola]MBO0343955.1 iron chelate uptake ABC transporter family permease subunit [Roseibium limicola]
MPRETPPQRPWIRVTLTTSIVAILLCLILISLSIGVIETSLADLFSQAADGEGLLLLSRLPRTLATLLAGASLAVAGFILQTLVQNRFVEPATVGTADSAALGLIGVSIVLPDAGIFSKMLVGSLAAFVGALGFLALVKRLPRTQPLLVPLCGIFYGGVISSVATFLAYENDLMQYIGIWMNGEFSGVLQGRYELLWASGLIALAGYAYADKFTIAGLGRDTASGLGLNYSQTIHLGLAIVAMVTAFTVITVGMLPFVGLVVPNIVSRFVGDNSRKVLPLVALVGGTFVLGSDILGRVLRFPYEIPAGAIFGVIGTFVFLWLLLARPSRA